MKAQDWPPLCASSLPADGAATAGHLAGSPPPRRRPPIPLSPPRAYAASPPWRSKARRSRQGGRPRRRSRRGRATPWPAALCADVCARARAWKVWGLVAAAPRPESAWGVRTTGGGRLCRGVVATCAECPTCAVAFLTLGNVYYVCLLCFPCCLFL